jgi:hypothetical protein
MQAREESMSVTPAWICNGSARFLSEFLSSGGQRMAVFLHIPYKRASILLLRERNVSLGGE